jgi:hypothetical protein
MQTSDCPLKQMLPTFSGSVLKMEAAYSFEALTSVYKTTRCDSPEDYNRNTLHCGNLKCYIYTYLYVFWLKTIRELPLIPLIIINRRGSVTRIRRRYEMCTIHKWTETGYKCTRISDGEHFFLFCKTKEKSRDDE